jgi:hypothetical protein
MSAPAAPADHSLEVEQMREQQAREAQTRQDALDKQRKEELAGLRTNARTSGITSTNNYLNEQGLVPGDYASQVDDFINGLMSGVAPDDPNPGAYVSNAGQKFYDQAQTGYRNKQERSLDQIFSPDFEMSRVPFTLDDASVSAIDAEQRQSADNVIKNMLNRHVITQSGFDAAENDLTKQGSGVRSRLNELGQGVLAKEQGSLRDIANRGRSAASRLSLGQSFDPYGYSTQVDQDFNDFVGSLGDKLRGSFSGNLYSTEGLGSIAGAASGAQNTAFDPKALSGIIDESNPDDKTTPRSGQTGIF